VPDESGPSWTFGTFKTYYDQRLLDLQVQLQQRFEAQQLSVAAALAAAEKAVNAALVAAEKAVDKAEQAQALRNEAQNEFRKSLSDLSGLMWTTKEGTAALDAMRREMSIKIDAIDQRVAILGNASEGMRGKSTGISSTVATGIAILALLLSAISSMLSYTHTPNATVVAPAVVPVGPK
jgi:hypothetical protein